MEQLNPLIQGTFSLMVGNFVGAISDRVTAMINERLKSGGPIELGPKSQSLTDSVLGLFLQAGFIAITTDLIQSALPWITEDVSSLTLYTLGVASTTTYMKRNLRILNSFILNESIYSKMNTDQKVVLDRKIEVPNPPPIVE